MHRQKTSNINCITIVFTFANPAPVPKFWSIPLPVQVAKPNPISPKRFANPTLYFGIPFRGLAYVSTAISTLSLAFTTCNALSYVRKKNSVYDPAYLKNLLTYVTISGSNAVPSFLLHFVTSTMSPTASLR